MEQKSLRAIITVVICLSVAVIGLVYQYKHGKDISANKEKSQTESVVENEYINQINQSKAQEGTESSNNDETTIVQSEENSTAAFSVDGNKVNEKEKVEFPVSELEDIDNETVEETADGYYSNEIVSITNLEVLTEGVEEINTYQLKYQTRSYLILSGYSDIYELSIDETSLDLQEDGYSFLAGLTDTEELYVSYEQDSDQYVFQIVKK